MGRSLCDFLTRNSDFAFRSCLKKMCIRDRCDTVLHGMGGDELSSRLKTAKETSIIPVILYGSQIDVDQRNKREASLADTFMPVSYTHLDVYKRQIME